MKTYLYRKFETDDVFVPFPMSPHVLNLRAPPPRVRPRFDMQRRATTVSALFIFCVFSAGIAASHMGTTLAYFNDNEVSQGNSFRAGSLGFSVQAEGTSHTFVSGSLGSAFEVSIITPDADVLPAHYNVRAEKTSGSDVFCGALHASATTSPFIYDGALTALDIEPAETGVWQMDITLSSEVGLLSGDQCLMDLVYKAWLDGAGPLGGYIQEERVPLAFTYENFAAAPAAPAAALLPVASFVGDAPSEEVPAPEEMQQVLDEAPAAEEEQAEEPSGAPPAEETVDNAEANAAEEEAPIVEESVEEPALEIIEITSDEEVTDEATVNEETAPEEPAPAENAEPSAEVTPAAE